MASHGLDCDCDDTTGSNLSKGIALRIGSSLSLCARPDGDDEAGKKWPVGRKPDDALHHRCTIGTVTRVIVVVLVCGTCAVSVTLIRESLRACVIVG